MKWPVMVSRWSAVRQRYANTDDGGQANRQEPGFARPGRVRDPSLHGILWMDMTWVTGRIAVGGGIWNAENMAAVARAGVTHIIDMQIEFDDTALAAPYGIEVLWNAVDDDFQPKPPEVFRRGVEFALAALDEPGTKLYIHCAAGVHRAPMMALAVLCSLSWSLPQALQLIEARRPMVDFADVYVQSVERFVQEYVAARQ